jgi:hypothetical protein
LSRAATNDVRTTKVRQRQNKIKPLEREQKELVIRRSTGRKEKFDTNRMAQTVSRSGVPFLMARDVAKKVSIKIKKDNQKSRSRRHDDGSNSGSKSRTSEAKGEKTVNGSRIRNLVANELRDRNRSDIADSYSGQVPANTLEEQNLKDKQPISDSVAANRNRVLHDASKRGGGIMN